MNNFLSEARKLGIQQLPDFSGKTIMMMPFRVEDPDTLSSLQLGGWKEVVQNLIPPSAKGIGYLTIDEGEVLKGKTLRRPGLHVDGYSSYGGPSPYGGVNLRDAHSVPKAYDESGSYASLTSWPYGGRPYASMKSSDSRNDGMILLSSNNGTRVFLQEFTGLPGPEGDCEHLRKQCNDGIILADNEAWWCSGFCVHEALPMKETAKRQVLRISMPSEAPYHWPYTENITGIKPVTPPGPDRSVFMRYKQQ